MGTVSNYRYLRVNMKAVISYKVIWAGEIKANFKKKRHIWKKIQNCSNWLVNPKDNLWIEYIEYYINVRFLQ